MLNNIIYSKIFSKIRQSENILLVCHERPDGDALGSICAMMDLIIELGINLTAYCSSEPPANFSYLPHFEKIISDKSKFNFKNFDLVITLDCGDLKRTKLVDEIKNKDKNQFVINIDHHPKIDDFADLEIKKTDVSSTTEIVFEFFSANNIKINKNVATCILTGISVDTGNFLYATSDETVRISSEMLNYGARLPKIMENTWRSKSLVGLKVWGTAMSRLEINKKYNIAWTVLTLKDVDGATDEELEGLSNFLGNLKGVKAVLIIYEKKEGMIKGSIRSSHPSADVSLLARALGGGGHPKAAGFTLEGKIVKKGERWEIE